MSQFDDLLGDFGETSTTTTTTKSSSNGGLDDFDPFGPSGGGVSTSNGGDSGLLMDWGTDGQNGGATNGVDLQFTTTTTTTSSTSGSANPLYDMDSDNQSSNPLYDLSGGSGNPLYDLSTAEDNNQSSNPLYDLDDSGHDHHQQQQDEMEEEQQQQQEEIVSTNQQVDLLSGTNEQQQQQEEVEEDRDQEGYMVDTRDDTHQPDLLGDSEEVTAPVEQESFTVVQEEEIVQDGHTVSKTSRTENRYSDSGLESKVSQQVSSNQWEGDMNRENAPARQTGEQDIVHFNEMTSVVNQFESGGPSPAPRRQVDIQQEVLAAEGGVYESQPQSFQQWQNEEEQEEGVYESTPQKRDDVARESDKDMNVDLPAVGTASSLRAKFMSGQVEGSTPRAKREITPPSQAAGGGEYVSEPRGYVEKYEGKAESGVFESQPHVPVDVVRAEDRFEEQLPEQGFARNVAARFKEMESKTSVQTSSGKREITPDRSGQAEYVSEPRTVVERYEGKAEAGVFESQPAYNPDVVRSGEEVQEALPERGSARHLADRFRQITVETKSPPSSAERAKIEISQAAVDAGVFENQPQEDPDVVKSHSQVEEYVPQRGFAKNVAARFKELETTAKSPPQSPGQRKEFTPPREESSIGSRQSGVYESTPVVQAEVVHSGDQLEESLPERGTARNIAMRFRQMESGGRTGDGPKPKKEFTPPPADSGVFENQPEQFQADYNRPAESGILENRPVQRDDLVRESEPPKYEEELPERGMARNLVSRWKQMESNSAKATSPGSGGRQKEFTPPREEPRIAEQRKFYNQTRLRSPRTPMSPPNAHMDNGSVHPTDLPGQYQPQNEATVFESTPDYRPDVIREADTDWTEGMPKKDQAKKMLARFQQIQADAKKEAPVPESRKESETSKPEDSPPMEKQKDPVKGPEQPSSNGKPYSVGNARSNFEDAQVGRSKSMRAAIQTEKCGACDKTVYAMERTEMNKRVYHKACFRCTQCKAVLTPKTFAINNEVIFCTNHYKQLFATKGNYDEGFGRMQHKKRWNSHPNLAEGEGEGSEKS